MNKYIVYFETLDEIEVGFLFEIDVTFNRANNPTDEEIILDYLKINYGDRVNLASLKWTVLEDVVSIDESYEIEV